MSGFSLQAMAGGESVNGSTAEVRCSFCAKEEKEVSKIIAGPGIYICDGCVARCNDILEEGEQPDRPQLPSWESMTDPELLEHLPRVAAVGEQVEANLRQWVLRARDRGIAWARIGDALGMTRQSAWGRFSGED
jgi:hypothetical protein